MASFSDIVSHKGQGITAIARQNGPSSSKKFITASTESEVYIWEPSVFTEKTEPVMKRIGTACHSCIAWRGDFVYFGYTTQDFLGEDVDMDKVCIGRAPFDDLESPSSILTFSLEPTCLDVSDKFLVGGSSEFVVKVAKLNSFEEQVKISLDGEVLDVKIDPTEEFFAAAVTDGSVLVFRTDAVETKEIAPVAKLSAVFPSISTIDVEKPREQMCWSADGKLLFVPSKGCVKVISVDGWEQDDSLKAPKKETESFSTCCLSADGAYLAAATLSGQICVWNVNEKTHLASQEYKRITPGKNIITSMTFSPSDARSIILVDANQGMSLLRNVIPSSASNQQTTKKMSKKRIVDSDDEETVDDDDERSKERPETIFIDDAADEDTNMSTDIGAIKKKFGFGDTLEDYGFGPEAERKSADPFARSEPVIQKITQVVEYDPPSIPSYFASGASPKNLSRRYLKWNEYGVVRSIHGDDYNDIEIEFHDTSISPEIRLNNNSTNYSMADLSDKAVALANVPEDENEQSLLFVQHVASWDMESRRWSIKLPLKENAVDVLVSRKQIAVITSLRNVRIFTLAGTQRHIISHPGPILTATCFESRVALISITGGEFFEADDDNEGEKRVAQYQYSSTVYDLDSKYWFQSEKNTWTEKVPVSPKEQLVWVGYTSAGKLTAMDSSYTMRVLTRGGLWIPVFNGVSEVKGKSDAIWPVSMVEGEGRQRQFRYLYCRGTKYPLMELKISLSMAPWSLPMCPTGSDRSKLEEGILFNELEQNDAFADPDADLTALAQKHVQALIRLFAFSCKSECETRASEFADLVRSAGGIQAMCTFATRLNKPLLSSKVAAIGRENLASDDSSNHRYKPSEDLAPKRVMMNRRTAETSFLDQSSIVEVPEEPMEETQPPSAETTLNASYTQIPVQRANRNPFKRTAESALETSSLSVFDQLDSSFDHPKKRGREDESPAPAKKQMKLSFGGTQQKGKENGTVVAYDLWLEENTDELRKEFNGDSEDFSKFCIGRFKTLPAKEKQVWRDRAAAHN